MGLLAPWFLAGALAVGLPLWLHLMRRRNPVRLPFSSLMFFEKRTETTIRERRLRYLLLLACRLALLLLLALAFAKPVWERPPIAIAGSIPKLHFIALDTSLSMRYGDRWERAVDEADAIVDSLGQGDQAQILANGPSVQVLTEPTSDKSALQRALAGLEPTSSRNDFGDLIEAVRNLTGDDATPSVLHLISDLQNSAMPSRFQDLVLPESSELALHDVAAGDFANWAIDSVKGSTRVYGRDAPKLESAVVSFAESEANKTVSLWIDGRLAASQQKSIAANGRESFVFEIPAAPRGFSRAELRLEPADALPDDDLRRVALDNSEPEPLLFISQDRRRRDLLYFKAALESSVASRYTLENASPGDASRLDPSRYALVVLSDVPRLDSGFESRLQAWIEAGGAVLIALGPNSALARRAPISGHSLEQPLSSERGGDPFQVAGPSDESHSVANAAEGLRPVKFFLYARVRPLEGDAVPMRLGNGDPLLVEREIGRGRALVFASAFDNIWNNLPVTSVYVPFVAEAVRYLTGAEAARGEALLGEVLELGRRRGSGATVQVLDPAGERVLTLSDSVSREAVPLESIGYYEIRGSDRSELLAVNADPRESNLRSVDRDTLELWQSTGGAEAAQAAAAGLPPPEVPPWRVWRLVLALLLLAVLLESLIADRHLDTLRGD